MKKRSAFVSGALCGFITAGALVAASNESWFAAVGMACCAITIGYRALSHVRAADTKE